MTKTYKKLAALFLVLSLAAAAFAAAAASGLAAGGKSGKKLLYDMEAGTTVKVKTTEAAYPHGKMTLVDNTKWAADYGAQAFDSRQNWTDAKYLVFYADNQAGEAKNLGVFIKMQVADVPPDTQYKPKNNLSGAVILDDTQAATPVETGAGDSNIPIPAGFRGYVKISLGADNFTYVWPDSTAVDWNLAHAAGVTFRADTDKMYVDTVALSYDDDMTAVLTAEEAQFGRAPYVPKYAEGKYVADGYDEDGWYAKNFDTLPTTENGYPSKMWAPVNGDAPLWWCDDIPDGDWRDWADAQYYMFYVDNRSGVEAELGMGLKQNGKDFRITPDGGGTAYLDNLADEADTVDKFDVNWGTVVSNTIIYTGVKIPAGFRGFVKVPLTDANFAPQHDDDKAAGVAFDKAVPVSMAHYNVYLPDGATGKLYVDTLALSYDDDILDTVEGQRFVNRPDFVREDGGKNEFNVVKDFYEVNRSRDYWDGAHGVSAQYDAHNRTMTVDYRGTGYNDMWGADEQIPRASRDWSDAKFFAVSAENLAESVSEFVLVVSPGSVGENRTERIKNGSVYYLQAEDGSVTSHVAPLGAVSLPVGFKGTVLIPVTAYAGIGQADLGQIRRFSLSFLSGKAARITFGQMGWADSNAALFEAPAIVDPTVYELPDSVPLNPPAPPRPSTEPSTAQDNRTE